PRFGPPPSAQSHPDCRRSLTLIAAAQLQLVRETGLTQREIAQKLGRTEAAVSGRLILIRKRAAERAD
ncbi:hypothetical protein ACVSQB_40875, partial [Bradyrhizobium elkanii]